MPVVDKNKSIASPTPDSTELSRRDFLGGSASALFASLLKFEVRELHPLVVDYLKQKPLAAGARLLDLSIRDGGALEQRAEAVQNMAISVQELLEGGNDLEHLDIPKFTTQADFDFWLAPVVRDLAETMSVSQELRKVIKEFNPIDDPIINRSRRSLADVDVSEVWPSVEVYGWRSFLKKNLKDPKSDLREDLALLGHADVSPELQERLIMKGEQLRDLRLAFKKIVDPLEEDEDEDRDLGQEESDNGDDDLNPSEEPVDVLLSQMLAAETDVARLQKFLSRKRKNTFLESSELKPMLRMTLEPKCDCRAILESPAVELRVAVYEAYLECRDIVRKLDDHQHHLSCLKDPVGYFAKHGVSLFSAYILTKPLPHEQECQKDKICLLFDALDRACTLCMAKVESDLPTWVVEMQEFGMWFRREQTSIQVSNLEFLRLQGPRAEYRGTLLYQPDSEVSETNVSTSAFRVPLRRAENDAHTIWPYRQKDTLLDDR